MGNVGVLVHNWCRIGDSGKKVSPTAKHASKKRALDAAKKQSAKGRRPIFHKATREIPSHFHPADAKGKLIHIHHDYGKPNPLAALICKD